MRRGTAGVLSVMLAAGLAAGGAGIAAANPNGSGGSGAPGIGDESPVARSVNPNATRDELPNPAEEKRRALRQAALGDVLKGSRKAVTKNGSSVVRVGTKKAAYTKAQLKLLKAGKQVAAKKVDQYVELQRERTDNIFVVLAEFGDERHPDFPDQDTNTDIAGPRTFDGPLHNSIPEPDRTQDNSTVWQADYSPDHYRQLYFGEGKGVESLKTYYEKQSSGRYSVDGEVTDWVKVRYNEARYGRSDYPTANNPAKCPALDNICTNTWQLLSDALSQWVADQKAKGRTDAQIKADVSKFDTWDRNDFDGDGNFNEPDGYIDHFQIVHAGGDQADGDEQQGEDAIWAHRWKAFQNTGQGPAQNPDGGTQIGNTGIWVADYTMQAENGGLSVFAHEYGHDLGLPDHYDAATDNPVNWWTLMAQSRARAKNDVGIGTRPADLGVWDKFQLGWLDYEVGVAGKKKTFKLGPHEYNSKKAQALAVVLPQKQVSTDLVTPASGSKQWWSGQSDDLTATLTRSVTLGAGAAQLSFKASYDIEAGYDFAVVEVDDGNGWKSLPTSLSTKGAAGTNGIDGSTDSAYVDGTVDLSAYAGKTVQLRFRYTTDGAASGNDLVAGNDGLFLDDIRVTSGGTEVFSDDVEAGAADWTASGFSVVGASVTTAYDQFYLASYRAYVSYDRYLKTGPYNFGWYPTPDPILQRVEFFPYQNGLLVNYWDTSQTDNRTSRHPGSGLVLPIDSHPRPIYNLSGVPWRGRIQTYDAPFGLEKADSFTLHYLGKPSYIRGQNAQPLFDDTRSYWNAELPYVGVKTPGVGVTLRVTKQDKTSMTVKLGVSPAAPTTVSSTTR